MPKLYEITDAYSGGDLPVEETVLPTDRPRVIINTAEFDKPKLDWDKGIEAYNSGVSDLKSKVSGIADAIKYASELDQKFTSSVLNFPKKAYENSDDLVKGLKNLFGLGEEERYQLWPEKVAREALTSAGDIAKPNPYPEGSEQYYEYEGRRQGGMVPAAMAISALAGSGGLGGTGAKAGEVALGATPFLRPALKHKEKLYKGKPGQEHQDIIPKELYEDFRHKAMSGEDLAEYNFGFINDKGHFLDREKALKYGIDTGIIDPHSGRFGALTTTLMADSSKPGMAIEAAAKTRTLIPAMKIGDKIYKGKPGDEHIDIINKNRLGLDDFEEGLGDNRFGFINHKGQFLNREKAMEYAKNNDLVKSRSKLLTSAMLLADSSKPGTAIEAMAKANPFYSAVEHTVKNIPQSKMTGEQWLGTIANKPGVKGEELDWTGLKSFLEENKGKPVTKAQIEEHLAANKVELKEVRKGGEAGTKEAAFELAKEHGWKSWDEIDAATQAKYMQRASREAGENPTKYHSYQLPGGENYREMLLTLPQRRASEEIALGNQAAELAKSLREKYGERWISKATPEEAHSYDLLITEAEHAGRNADSAINYKSSHWDEPNILAHVRMNDRNIDGKKSLHLEEIQSDWHQQGRNKGYNLTDKEYQKLDADYKQALKDRNQYDFNSPEYKEGTKKAEALGKQLRDSRDAIPDAPFKKSWHELALKRMIREAAEKGYDRLSWTPGEAQAARYSLEKQLKELQYLKNDDGTYSIAGVTKDGGGFNHPENVTADKLPNIVGKEMAEKIIKNEGKRARGHPANGGYFEGVDLKIGGEGMKGFYDQIIPKALEKLGKEHGVKVKKGKIGSDKVPDNFEIEHTGSGWRVVDMSQNQGQGTFIGPIHRSGADAEKWLQAQGHMQQPIFYIDIPQSLKDTALNKGFPLFSASPGYMFVPFEGDPFKDLK